MQQTRRLADYRGWKSGFERAGREMSERKPRRIRLITVCDKCLTACCWHGIFMCDNAYGAGTVEKTARELRKLNLEHPSYYSAKEVARVCGDNIYREANR